MNMNPQCSLNKLFQTWSVNNPAHLHSAQLQALRNACALFGEVSDWPYEKVPSEMLDTFISSRQSEGSRRNMRYLITTLDQSIRDFANPYFAHPAINDAHLIWLMLHLRYAVQVDSIRDRIFSIHTDHQPFEVFAGKYLVSLYGSSAEGTINLRRKAILMCGFLFGKPASLLTKEKIEELVSSSPYWIHSSMRCALKGIAALASGYENDQVIPISIPHTADRACDDVPAEEQTLSFCEESPEALPPEKNHTISVSPVSANNASFYEFWSATLFDLHQIWVQQCAPLLAKNSQQKLNTGWNVLKPLWNRPFRGIKIFEIQELFISVPSSTQRSTYEMYSKLEELAFSLDIINRRRSHLLVRDEIILQPRIPLTDGDIKNLWRHQGEWFVDITLALYYTGFRAGELAKLKKTDVNLQRLEITGGSKTQFGINRLIPIHQRIEPIIRKWLAEEPGKYLIPRESGERFSNRDIEHAVKMATAAYCERPHIPHECRHTFYTNLQRNDENSAACVARLAGHNPRPLPVDIRVYAKPTSEQLRAAIHVL